MQDCLLLPANEQQAHALPLDIEDLGEEWRCEAVTTADGAYQRLMQRPCHVLIVCSGPEGEKLLARMGQRPPLSPPWLIAEAPCPWADGLLTSPAGLPAMLEGWRQAGRIPRLAQLRHDQLLCLARGLMSTMTVPRRLRAWQFLPDMAALATVHPPLMEDLRGRLYPLVARRHGLTPGAVERSLRLAIESTWSGASLPALERFFGHSVDPERGKPTNREFLCRVQERLTLAARRIA